MLSRIASALVPAFGRLTVTADPGARPATGSILVANHTSLADPAVVVAALRRHGIEPVILATAGLWRVPLLGPALRREGHIAVHRGTARAADSLDAAAVALASGRSVLLYGEGGLPPRRDAGESAPGPFRSGLARLAAATGAPVVPVGQAGSRRLCSGSRTKQLAGVFTAPLRRPCLHVHIGSPLQLPTRVAEATDRAHEAVTAAWRTAASAVGETCAAA
ncbi:lysophospholipid acyltransferase family protein [Streptomyces sp. NRRL F-4428]|uniref:lysophospholipid acyltransferase family protein n=1 Tax=Streptomyces sp. NRRL F-4428 TaxID=1609137 RepID=UPI0004AAE735|nr:lysophospholipid acyltransferase family protein [Streptomyces sp. NRRL F-4428]KJK53503.1 acyltransferase [Streptomyces sp. NRRL F-4428]